MIRPAAASAINRWAELASVGVIAAAGAALVAQGGFVLMPLGAVIIAASLPLGLTAYRRARFLQNETGQGLVEVVEGELRFYAPQEAGNSDNARGGFINLPDLQELRLIHLDHHRFWRLETIDGQALMVPVDAAGHAALFDVFAALTNIDSAALIHALTHTPGTGNATYTLWRRNSP